MKHETTRQLFRYWNEVRGSRASPDRDAIEPTAIRDILADTFILETRPDGTFRFRLSGTRLDALRLRALKDQCFLDFWGDERHSVAAALWTVMDGTLPVLLGVRITAAGHPAASAEGLLLPLRDHGRTHSLILGALSFAAAPPWVGLGPATSFRLASMRVLAPAEVIDLPIMSRPQRVATARPVEKRGHLTVYAGGR